MLDSETGEPVVFATVRLKGKALGVISNKDGGFQVPLEFQQKGEALVISCMGYETKTIAFGELKYNELNQVNLQPSLFELNEATVEGRRRRRPTAKQIIRYALQRIPENYSQTPFDIIGYYRDYQYKDEDYINLNEALVQVIDDGFKELDYTKLRFGLYDYKRNTEFEIDTFAAKPYDYKRRDKFIPNATFGTTYAGNELVLLFIHDAIRNYKTRSYSYVYRMVEDFIKNHRFLGVKMTNYGKNSVYQINFRKSDTPFQVYGSIYVDVSSFSIRKLDYAVYKQEYDDDSPNYYSTLKKDLLYEILVEYNDFDGQMYLNYISFHNQFELVRPPKFYIKEVLLNSSKREMRVFLNQTMANFPDDFSVKYEGKSLPIAGAYQIDDSSFALLFPIKDFNKNERLRKLFNKTESEENNALEIEIKELTDKSGNYLNKREVEMVDQFREFFTQQIKTDNASHFDASNMVDNVRSLGDKAQQKLKKSQGQDFWMNTPLKSIP